MHSKFSGGHSQSDNPIFIKFLTILSSVEWYEITASLPPIPNNEKESRSKHGLYRALIFNMIEGVSKGYSKELELVGVGYRAASKGQELELSLGFSHNIVMEICPEVKVETVSEKGANPIVKLTSHDKQLIGMVAAKIRSLRKPEPYKGKGIKFVGEQIRRKAGKTAG